TVHDSVNDLDSTTVSNVNQEPGSQSEATIASDPSDPTRLFAASNRADAGLMTAFSSNAGVTWNPRTLASGPDVLPIANGDPKVVFDSFGNLFLTYLTAEEPNAVVVALSTDGGQSFQVLQTFLEPGGTDQPSL